MRPWLLMFLLLLSILIHEAQSIRLRKGSLPATHRQHHIHELLPGKRNNEDVSLSKSKHWSGRIRKLTVTPISSTVSISKNHKNEESKAQSKSMGSSTYKHFSRKEENLSVNSWSKTQQKQSSYPDILDIAGMDYSLARRKPPIHN